MLGKSSMLILLNSVLVLSIQETSSPSSSPLLLSRSLLMFFCSVSLQFPTQTFFVAAESCAQVRDSLNKPRLTIRTTAVGNPSVVAFTNKKLMAAPVVFHFRGRAKLSHFSSCEKVLLTFQREMIARKHLLVVTHRIHLWHIYLDLP